MASIISSLNDAFSEDAAGLKIFIYSVPVFFVANLFVSGQMSMFYLWGGVLGLILLGVITQGIYNTRRNKRVIMTINPIELFHSLITTAIAVIPQVLIFGLIGKLVIKFVPIPSEIPHLQLIFEIVVWALLFSIVFTSYLSFAKDLKISQAYNYGVIFNSCIDVLVALLFALPQLLLADLVLIGPGAYLIHILHMEYTHWSFILYCSIMFVINISIFANFFAQLSYEQIHDESENHEDNYTLTNALIKDLHDGEK